MASIQIPRTAKAVVAELGTVGELLTATEWRKAALIASVVRLPGRGARREEAGSSFFTAEQFADQRLAGLRSKDTVRLYVERWLAANDGAYPRLGAKVKLPTDEWPPSRTGTDGYESEDGLAKTVGRLIDKHGPEPIIKAVAKADPIAVAEEGERRRRQLVDDANRRESEGRTTARQGTTRSERADVVEHGVQHWLDGARSYLRHAAVEMERNPHLTARQRREADAALAEIEHLVHLLGGKQTAWTDEDRAFLESLEVSE